MLKYAVVSPKNALKNFTQSESHQKAEVPQTGDPASLFWTTQIRENSDQDALLVNKGMSIKGRNQLWMCPLQKMTSAPAEVK